MQLTTRARLSARLLSLLDYQRRPNPSASYTDAQDFRVIIDLFILVADVHYCATAFYLTNYVYLLFLYLCIIP